VSTTLSNIRPFLKIAGFFTVKKDLMSKVQGKFNLFSLFLNLYEFWKMSNLCLRFL